MLWTSPVLGLLRCRYCDWITFFASCQVLQYVNLSEPGNTTSGKSGPVATCGRCTGREGETGDPARTGAKLEFIHGKCVYCRWVHGKWVTAGCNVCCTSSHLLLRCDFFAIWFAMPLAAWQCLSQIHFVLRANRRSRAQRSDEKLAPMATGPAIRRPQA